MLKLFNKSEMSFAILWIVIYVVINSLADNVSATLGVYKSATMLVNIVMSVVLFVWIRKNGLSEKYGLCKSDVPAKKFLYFIPLVIIASSSLWFGVTMNYSPVESLCFVVSMCGVGFLEEVIFRGLLFKAMEKDGVKSAIVVSALTFGMGHIVNLVNGNSDDPVETIVQIIFAILVGFVLVLIFYLGGSLIPCIVYHAVNNSLIAFRAEGSFNPHIELFIKLALYIIVLGGYVVYLLQKSEKYFGKDLKL